MINALKSWKGHVEVNGTLYDSIHNVPDFGLIEGKDTYNIKLLHKQEKAKTQTIRPIDENTEYKITVKAYMTKKASVDFDFMEKWNNNTPMPMRTMIGTIEKETRGMVYMKLHGYAKETITCMCCGKELTNPISRKYGIGPICLSKIGIFTDIENVDDIKEQLVKITWEGWIIKSSLLQFEEIT